MEPARVAPKPRDPHPTALSMKDDLALVLTGALWQLRHQIPDMTLEIEIDEIDKFQKSLEYNEQKPKLQLNATHDRLVVSMCDAKTGAAIVQSESTQADQDKKEASVRLRKMISDAPQLVADHEAMIRRGEGSDSMSRELHETVMALVRALR